MQDAHGSFLQVDPNPPNNAPDCMMYCTIVTCSLSPTSLLSEVEIPFPAEMSLLSDCKRGLGWLLWQDVLALLGPIPHPVVFSQIHSRVTAPVWRLLPLLQSISNFPPVSLVQSSPRPSFLFTLTFDLILSLVFAPPEPPASSVISFLRIQIHISTHTAAHHPAPSSQPKTH